MGVVGGWPKERVAVKASGSSCLGKTGHLCIISLHRSYSHRGDRSWGTVHQPPGAVSPLGGREPVLCSSALKKSFCAWEWGQRIPFELLYHIPLHTGCGCRMGEEVAKDLSASDRGPTRCSVTCRVPGLEPCPAGTAAFSLEPGHARPSTGGWGLCLIPSSKQPCQPGINLLLQMERLRHGGSA